MLSAIKSIIDFLHNLGSEVLTSPKCGTEVPLPVGYARSIIIYKQRGRQNENTQTNTTHTTATSNGRRYKNT